MVTGCPYGITDPRVLMCNQMKLVHRSLRRFLVLATYVGEQTIFFGQYDIFSYCEKIPTERDLEGGFFFRFSTILSTILGDGKMRWIF